MDKIIHLTDTHLVPPLRKLYALDPRERLAAAVAHINRYHDDALGVFITGDLAHWGEAGAYMALREQLDALTVPSYPALGNHDARGAFTAIFPEVPRDQAGYVQYAAPLGDAVGLVLDTLVEGATGGQLCRQRLDWLERQLAAHRNRPVFVFLHHPPLPIGIPGMDSIALMDGVGEFERLLKQHGRVRHIFFGHVHRPIAGSWKGIPLSTLPATNHQVALQLSEPEAVPGTHEPPAYGVVLTDDSSVIVHVCSYMDDSAYYLLDSAEAEAAQDLSALPLLERA